ncbi:DUF6578 domain-containing protein [Gulosibacter sp. 10]|uniref:DUF6578 domain-containing protein n=1 Tax=Gulosibacter sp. 10 TaxID=1255570 RepID=UPI00097F526C|nr:DUF6578 domain-containing protein [Gulosibacter sp. 10]SJM50542.1 hypothetical protein FM112_01460 [Gulosibacter sp. 10]
MRIEVELSAWQFDCCGTIPEIGEEVRWTIYANDPAARSASRLPSYSEDHHDTPPAGAPTRAVEGLVVGRRAVRFPVVPVIGNPIGSTVDHAHPRFGEIEEFEREGLGYEYVIELEVPDDAELPPYERPPRREDRTDADSVDMTDAVGTALVGLLARLRTAYGECARIDVADGGRAVSVRPYEEEATGVHWGRFGGDDPRLMAYAGRGRWRLPDAVESVRTIERLAAAAARGDVAEVAGPDEPASMATLTRADLHGEEPMVFRHPDTRRRLGTSKENGAVVMMGRMLPARRYSAWS